MVNECRFIKTNGLKCGSPALRGSQFCYFHGRRRIYLSPRPRRQPREEPINLPVLRDPSDMLATINELLDGLASNRISPKRAGSILYALQLARQNFESPAVGQRPDLNKLIREIAHAPERS